MTFIDALKWRYATKRMNGKKVSQQKIDNILEATRLSASSMGLQPYNIIVVESEELRKKILPLANNQPQIVEASHLLIFAAWDNITEKHADDYIHNISQVREIPFEKLDGIRRMLAPIISGARTQEQNFQWAARQTYIAFGTAIAAAAMEEVDATPMEGFNGPALDELLNLKEKGLRSVTLLPLGYRNAEADFLAHAKKVRRDKKNLFLELA